MYKLPSLFIPFFVWLCSVHGVCSWNDCTNLQVYWPLFVSGFSVVGVCSWIDCTNSQVYLTHFVLVCSVVGVCSRNDFTIFYVNLSLFLFGFLFELTVVEILEHTHSQIYQSHFVLVCWFLQFNDCTSFQVYSPRLFF